jgi:hypothetical protein
MKAARYCSMQTRQNGLCQQHRFLLKTILEMKMMSSPMIRLPTRNWSASLPIVNLMMSLFIPMTS